MSKGLHNIIFFNTNAEHISLIPILDFSYKFFVMVPLRIISDNRSILPGYTQIRLMNIICWWFAETSTKENSGQTIQKKMFFIYNKTAKINKVIETWIDKLTNDLIHCFSLLTSKKIVYFMWIKYELAMKRHTVYGTFVHKTSEQNPFHEWARIIPMCNQF